MVDSNSYSNKAVQPPQWGDLLNYSDKILDGATHRDRLQKGQVNQVLSIVRNFDNRDLEHLRYFGFGEVISGTGSFLSDLSVMDEAIHGAAIGLATSHFDRYLLRDRGGLRLFDIDNEYMRPPFIEAAHNSRALIPPGVLLLTDCLQLESLWRRKRIMTKCHNLIPGIIEATKLEVSTDFVGTSSLLAASGIYRSCLFETYVKRHGKPNDEAVRDDPYVLKIRNENGLRGIRLLRAATYVAKLRKDEVSAGQIAHECINIGASPVIEFDKSKVPKCPPPVDNSGKFDIEEVLIHDDRIGCPAIYCGPVIDKMLGAMPPIFIEADSLIKAA